MSVINIFKSKNNLVNTDNDGDGKKIIQPKESKELKILFVKGFRATRILSADFL